MRCFPPSPHPLLFPCHTLCHSQNKRTRDSVRSALFKAVFGPEAYNVLARRKKVGGGAGDPVDTTTTAGDDSSDSVSGSDDDGLDANPPHARGHGRRLSCRGMERVLRAQLSSCRCLLVLDGCDDAMGSEWMARLLSKLLRDDKGVHVLFTCREDPTATIGLSTSCPASLVAAWGCCWSLMRAPHTQACASTS